MQALAGVAEWRLEALDVARAEAVQGDREVLDADQWHGVRLRYVGHSCGASYERGAGDAILDEGGSL